MWEIRSIPREAGVEVGWCAARGLWVGDWVVSYAVGWGGEPGGLCEGDWGMNRVLCSDLVLDCPDVEGGGCMVFDDCEVEVVGVVFRWGGCG